MNNSISSNKIWTGLLFLAVLPMPVAYYSLLRYVICGVCLYYFFDKKQKYKEFFKWLFVLIAIIFNPLAPFYFGKPIWVLIDIICGLFFLWLNTSYSRSLFK